MNKNNNSLPAFTNSPCLVYCPDDVPLSVRLDVKTDGADRISIHIIQSGITWTLDHPISEHPILLLGFLPDGEAAISLKLKGTSGSVNYHKKLKFRPFAVPTNPLEMPPIKVFHSEPNRMSGKFTFLSIRRRAIGRPGNLSSAQRKFSTQWGMLIAIDHYGRIRWIKKMPSRVAGIERLKNGNLFIHDTEFCSREIAMDGKHVNSWYAEKRPQGHHPTAIPINVESLHHQPHQMPNGNFLAVSGVSRLIKQWPASVHYPKKFKEDKNIVGDKVIEFTPAGNVVWEWNCFDHLDVYRVGYDALDPYWHVRGFPNHGDWTHCNGVTYDEKNNQVLLSLRLQDCIIAIDKKSGEINWILGDHAGWSKHYKNKLLKPKGDCFRWPWHGHNPRMTGSNQFIMFDNGIYQARPGHQRVPFHKSFSRGVEYRVDPSTMTVEQVWSSAHKEEDVKERSWAMSDAHRFMDTNTALVIHSIAMPHDRNDIGMDEDDNTKRYVSEFPSYARILEYNRKNIHDLIFDCYIRDENEIIQWEVFSGVRVKNLYPENANVIWTDGNE